MSKVDSIAKHISRCGKNLYDLVEKKCTGKLFDPIVVKENYIEVTYGVHVEQFSGDISHGMAISIDAYDDKFRPGAIIMIVSQGGYEFSEIENKDEIHGESFIYFKSAIQGKHGDGGYVIITKTIRFEKIDDELVIKLDGVEVDRFYVEKFEFSIDNNTIVIATDDNISLKVRMKYLPAGYVVKR